MTTASICTIGDEILIGQIVDTNSSHISRALNSLGIKVIYMTSIGDNNEQIVNELNKCLSNSDIVIVTGGLGPTKDDITKAALAQISGASKFIRNMEQYEVVDRILKTRGIPMLDINAAQADVPDTCDVIVNNLGTAPCMVFHHLGQKKQASLYSLPGVPFEALNLIEPVLENIKENFSLEKISHKTITTFGIAESALAKMIEKWENDLPSNIKLAYLPNTLSGVRLRLTQFGGNADFTPYISSLKEILGDAIYGQDDDTLPVVIGRMLKSKGKTMAAAESCTGGLISHLMTSVAGCSDYYKGSVTSYANEVKMGVLGVPKEIIESYGAVSEECVCAMAKGVMLTLDTDYAVATSGIAGPTGATQGKPVGMAWIAAARKNDDGSIEVFTKKVQFSSNRATNIERFASSALNLLRLTIR